jgi:hypothetical protein
MAFSAGGEPLPMQAAELAGWPSLQAHDAQTPNPDRVGRFGTKHGGVNLNDEAAMLAGWGTLRVTTNGGQGSIREDAKARVEDQAAELAGWPRLVAQDSHGHGYTSGRGETVPGVASSSSGLTARENTGESGALSPRFASWLMGVPAEVLACASQKNPQPRFRVRGSHSLRPKSRRASES